MANVLFRPWEIEPSEEPISRRTSQRILREAASSALLLCHSLTTQQVSRLLGVSCRRVRKRLSSKEKTLYGFLWKGRWRLPRFQFMGDDTLPYIEFVLPHVPENASPVAVHLWFVDPNPALVDPATGDPLSPREWLLRGYSPEPLKELVQQMENEPAAA
ncbi:hypothetical protein JCM30394_29920 [Deferrisoma palaeochoriense]